MRCGNRPGSIAGTWSCSGRRWASSAMTTSTAITPCPSRCPPNASSLPIFRLDHRIAFPPVQYAEDGLLAVGGDLRPERLLLAYRSGIFPWYSEGQPILWHSPDPRMVLVTRDLEVPHSLRKTIRRQRYRLTLDAAFGKVVAACASVERPGQSGTWITPDMQAAYRELHRRGPAHSGGAGEEGRPGGGPYAGSPGAARCGGRRFC